jgi:hypothetical protein
MTDDPRTDELTPETRADDPMPAPPGDGSTPLPPAEDPTPPADDELTPETRADDPMPAPPGDDLAPVPPAAERTSASDTLTEDDAPLFDRTDEWAGRWDGIQLRFVDEPRRSIEDADALVDEVIERLTARLADERQRLEHEWAAGTEPSTEDLRLALQHYRAFFTRLLAA